MQSKKRLIALLAVCALIASLMPQAVFAAAYRAEFGAQLNPEVNADIGEWPDMSQYGAVPEFDYDQEVTVTLDFGAPVAFGGNYAAIETNAPYPGSEGRIISFKLDGNEVAMGDAYLNDEGLDKGSTLRLTLCNKWNSDIADQPVDVETLGEFTTLEITFTVFPEGGGAPAPAADPEPVAAEAAPIAADAGAAGQPAAGGANPATGDSGILSFALIGLAAACVLLFIKKKAAR